MKLCKDCKWCETDNPQRFEYARCGRPGARSMVDDKAYKFCSMEREFHPFLFWMLCGLSAKYFQKK